MSNNNQANGNEKQNGNSNAIEPVKFFETIPKEIVSKSVKVALLTGITGQVSFFLKINFNCAVSVSLLKYLKIFQ